MHIPFSFWKLAWLPRVSVDQMVLIIGTGSVLDTVSVDQLVLIIGTGSVLDTVSVDQLVLVVGQGLPLYSDFVMTAKRNAGQNDTIVCGNYAILNHIGATVTVAGSAAGNNGTYVVVSKSGKTINITPLSLAANESGWVNQALTIN